ncbi:RTX toxin transporter [Dulcicalothrix desertica PCC 7102]|uniref:RTX toxin transporter n=1 Tax=Dulcicalothrix desertica PCC 7102 TaxID=232991 RepID=A0A3S1CKY4_9CYAN|nr:HlyD family efflux transporter periplasmic adaptor subunit [Dulcicalothrix desertica]RUT04765.1 RTX toxin transporter [Dulcicalothrix desertica PCC 7102]TWH42775.1 HlyD family secretion protein [Dulcicalothrix desertica PCC 7102]
MKTKQNGSIRDARDLPMVTKSHNFTSEQSVVLRQSPIWSRAIMVSLMGVACFSIIWACVAKIEQVVPAVGQLKPKEAIKEVQAPFSGIVKQLYIKDGQQVKAGDLLLTFDSGANRAEIESLQKIRASILQQNQLYRSLTVSDSLAPTQIELLQKKLPREVIFLLKSRTALLAENQLLRKELDNTGEGQQFDNDSQQRLQFAKKELDTRTAAARLEVEQVKKELAQNQVKIEDSQASLKIEQSILDKLKPLAEQGAIAQLQYLQQQQKVQNRNAEIATLIQEQQRLQYKIEQGRQQTDNTVAVSGKNIHDKIADNKKNIAEIDTQFTKIMLENEQRLADTNSKLAQAKLNMKYQELRAPIAGTIFDLQAKNAGFVASPTQQLLKIVPNDNYVAEIYITNKDIGFVKEGMKVDVRVDSFPYSEFGEIKGNISWIASDALPPDQTHQFYRFPAKVVLEKQKLNIKGREVGVQSGMSITANVKIREERRVINLITDMFTNQADNLKQVR